MNELNQFIERQLNQHEAGLVIAERSATDHVASVLEGKGYANVNSIESLMREAASGKKLFWMYESGDFQLLYSFILQLPGELISLFDSVSGETYRLDSQLVGFILVITPSDLQALESAGFAVRSRVGLCISVNQN